jgi:SAM-dependent methyltransferase
MKSAKPKILDVGCGDAKVKGAVGIDCVKLPGVDIVHDLKKYPWPIKGQSYDLIYLNNIIEHLPNPIKFMEEVYRICKIGGKVKIVTVYWNHYHSITDPQHVSFFNEYSWDFFTGKRKGYYTKCRFEIEDLTLTYDSYAKKVFKNRRLLRFLSRFLSNIIDGIHVTLVRRHR